MTETHFTLTTDEDGVALFVWDSPGRSMNVFTEAVMDELEAHIEALVKDEAVRGAIIASGKSTFSGGADLSMLQALLGRYHAMAREDQPAAMAWLFTAGARMSRMWRRLETAGKPFVAAVGGTCMGGAFEMALACHGRIAAEGDYVMGLPEVKIGIFPGAGGTQRVMRMADPQAGLTFLLQGQTVAPKKAVALKLFDKVVPAEGLLAEAKAMIMAGLDPVRPWDKHDFRLPGGKVYSPAGFQFWPAANAIYRRETHDNYPGARAILAACYEGLQLPMDQGLRVEARQFAHVLTTTEAASMVRSLFVSMQALSKGARRPKDIPPMTPRRIGVIGAGFMGSGIAHAAAGAGIEVMLIDADRDSAERGKETAAKLVAERVSKRRMTSEDGETLLSRISASDDYSALADCDLVIEAVFEDRTVKAAVMDKAAKAMKADAIFASNTSTLPITSLGANWASPQAMIGLHFFSPVHKMKLVEVILGEKTGDKALAVALDFVRAIGKTPIVVHDSRGFYANRCVMNYLLEAHLMLTEGVPPAMVENVARMAGMPVGPLALNDEVGVDLAWKILQATKADLGETAIDPRQAKLLEEMVVARGRHGRKNGAGFYDYPAKGPKRLWRGIAEIVGEPRAAEDFDVEELKTRLLATQALEAARCIAEGVVTDVREADVGSILGFGFAPFSGGTISYIDGLGTKAFVDMADTLTERHGPRFAPNTLLKEMAATNELFYERFAPPGAPAA
ncbi:Fatty acid oxidation complex subunit alpha [Hartmannibacter diazotrophicus]|uniref:Fatty acid oxidation complex subunit alpha n=1 Tax=Hartmannibacter diazotrophicus TaxID=1482074 RepID=A0A2C9DDI8_9HYPH|nr:3-hydroxyacyl-CoA dehydrogenase NAD-binding domain-containing protein [Hartmannibacter diazotrophicus]SON58326.1 Fatty acid oxidation complex subunit alpha [Hartmannibacter diazotrophicus]